MQARHCLPFNINMQSGYIANIMWKYHQVRGPSHISPGFHAQHLGSNSANIFQLQVAYWVVSNRIIAASLWDHLAIRSTKIISSGFVSKVGYHKSKSLSSLSKTFPMQQWPYMEVYLIFRHTIFYWQLSFLSVWFKETHRHHQQDFLKIQVSSKHHFLRMATLN